MPQVNVASVLTKFSQTLGDNWEVGNHKGYTIKARLPHAGKPARKLD